MSFSFGELLASHVGTPILADKDAGSITGSPPLRDGGVALGLADRAPFLIDESDLAAEVAAALSSTRSSMRRKLWIDSII